jgi:prepilin-type N-terminal cleavage/methylation domain-containing protein
VDLDELRRMTRLRNHDGMTLPELLVAMVIGMIVSLAAFSLIETTMRRTADTSSRVDTTQRGRVAMDFVTRELRSQVCVQATAPVMTDDRAIYAATPTSVTFFSDLSDESFRAGNTIKAPELRSISLETGKLIERRWAGVATGTAALPTYSYAGYPGTPTATRVLIDDASTSEVTTTGAAPLVFRYWVYDTTVAPPKLIELDTRAGVTVPQATLIAQIDIAFRANRARGKATDRGASVFEDTVFTRIADPNNTTNPSPVCA